MDWAKIIAFLVIGATATGAQTQPPPQTARQAVLEMLFSKDPKAVQKHIPENAQKILAETDSGLLNMLTAQLSAIQREAVNNKGHIETFDAGPLLFTSENSASVRPQRIEIVVDRDDLSGDEDQIELSLRTYKNGVLDHMPVVPSLILDMKQEKDIWRLGQITLAIHVPLSDPDYVKSIADDMHKTRQRMAEYGAIMSLQSLETAEVSRQKKSTGSYTCNLADLGGGWEGTSGDQGAQGQMIDIKKDFIFKIADCSGSSLHITAEPAKGGPARRAFCIDETSAVRFADDGKASSCLSSGRPIREMQLGGGNQYVGPGNF